MTTKFAIEIRPSWNPMARAYVRVYQNGREWVTRVHTKTATQFNTREAAQAAIAKFNLIETHKATIVSA